MTDTPNLSALAMRTRAAEALTSLPVFCGANSDLQNGTAAMVIGRAQAAILALPLEADPAALVEEALRLPEIAAMVEAGDVMANALRGNYIVPGSAAAWREALAALVQP